MEVDIRFGIDNLFATDPPSYGRQVSTSVNSGTGQTLKSVTTARPARLRGLHGELCARRVDKLVQRDGAGGESGRPLSSCLEGSRGRAATLEAITRGPCSCWPNGPHRATSTRDGDGKRLRSVFGAFDPEGTSHHQAANWAAPRGGQSQCWPRSAAHPQSWQRRGRERVLGRAGWLKARGQLRLSATRADGARSHAEIPSEGLAPTGRDTIDLSAGTNVAPAGFVRIASRASFRPRSGSLSGMIEHARPSLTRALVMTRSENRRQIKRGRYRCAVNTTTGREVRPMQICANTGASFAIEPCRAALDVGGKYRHFDSSIRMHRVNRKSRSRPAQSHVYAVLTRTTREGRTRCRRSASRTRANSAAVLLVKYEEREPDSEPHAGARRSAAEKWVVSQWIRSRATF